MRGRWSLHYLSAAGAALVFLAFETHAATAQSLGDIAQREAERRTQVTPGRIYTNGDLVPVDPPQSPPAPDPVAVAASVDSTPAPEKEVEPPAAKPTFKAREKRDEQYWRTLAQDLRGRLARATADVAATESRLAEIDAGPQTPAMSQERVVVAAALVRLRREARFRYEELTRFMTRAQVAGVPSEWTR